ncbi:MAG: DUF3482 domain-containing protein [Gammaproteobacteria bacterium]|nr:DUF3482 domain-containing protein [Gammaproteobacteria bacterium]
MTSLTAHQEFYRHTSALAQELKSIESQVRDKDQQLRQGISKLTESVRKAGKVKQSKTVSALVAGYFNQVDQVLTAWERRVGSYDAGLSLRHRFGDSLLVFVYGKVKAGKSSLGNFVATGRGTPGLDWLKELGKRLHTPEYFVADKNEKFAESIDHSQGFQVGAAETTSCIQGFSVPGMTWVDSPGLHSVNSENGDLAQKYVESADLIIYPMNSAQPGRKTDLDELEELLKAGKRILVLITRCDEVEPDVNESGEVVETTVMKPEQSRQDQANYVQQELNEICTRLDIHHADTSVMCVSVGYAEEHGNSEAAMQDSGMQALFDKLQAMLKSEGVEMKKQAPLKNLHNFYAQLLATDGELSLSRLLVPLKQAQEEISSLERQLGQIGEQAESRIMLDFSTALEQLVERCAESNAMDELEQQLQACLTQAVEKHYQQPVQQLYQEAIDAFAGAASKMGLCMDLQFADKTQEITVDVSRKSAAVGSGAGALAGAIIGGIISGGVGIGFGATIGGMLGGATGSAFNSQQQRTICIGDNREEIKSELLASGQEKIHQIVSQANRKTEQDLLKPMQKALQQVHVLATEFQSYLKEQHHV